MTHPHRTVSPWASGILDARLAELVAQKLSARAIGEQLGVSRCAVIGRARRLGLQLLFPSHHGGNPTPHRKHKPQPAVKKFGAALLGRSSAVGEDGPAVTPGCRGAEALPMPPVGIVPLLELRPRQCRFAYGDGPPYLFCGQPTPKGSSWCSAHMRVVFT